MRDEKPYDRVHPRRPGRSDYPLPGRRTGEIAVGRDRGRILRIAPVVRMVRQGAAAVRLQRDARRIYRDVPADERRRRRLISLVK